MTERKRIRKPIEGLASGLPEMIRSARKAKGWSLRELEAETQRLAGHEDSGTTINVLSFWERGVVREPKLTNLYLVGKALGIPLRRMIEALGFDLELSREPVTDERRQRAQTILGVASEDDLGRIERLLSLDEAERRAVDAFLESLRRKK